MNFSPRSRGSSATSRAATRARSAPASGAGRAIRRAEGACGCGVDREGDGGLNTLVEDEELQCLRVMAEGSKPFKESRLWERLAALDLKEFWKLPAREQLAVGYYQTAKRRADVLARDAASVSSPPG